MAKIILPVSGHISSRVIHDSDGTSIMFLYRANDRDAIIAALNGFEKAVEALQKISIGDFTEIGHCMQIADDALEDLEALDD